MYLSATSNAGEDCMKVAQRVKQQVDDCTNAYRRLGVPWDEAESYCARWYAGTCEPSVRLLGQRPPECAGGGKVSIGGWCVKEAPRSKIIAPIPYDTPPVPTPPPQYLVEQLYKSVEKDPTTGRAVVKDPVRILAPPPTPTPPRFVAAPLPVLTPIVTAAPVTPPAPAPATTGWEEIARRITESMNLNTPVIPKPMTIETAPLVQTAVPPVQTAIIPKSESPLSSLPSWWPIAAGAAALLLVLR